MDKKELKEEVLNTAKLLGTLKGFKLLMLDTENKFVSTGVAPLIETPPACSWAVADADRVWVKSMPGPLPTGMLRNSSIEYASPTAPSVRRGLTMTVPPSGSPGSIVKLPRKRWERCRSKTLEASASP